MLLRPLVATPEPLKEHSRRDLERECVDRCRRATTSSACTFSHPEAVLSADGEHHRADVSYLSALLHGRDFLASRPIG